ncbi:ankyrin repeat domain-containing protein SOWAHC-like, partial [Pan troglodytes]|uniref:ankyrin repeat domain-containing protein SOWAHC-like n=1 Tax=Pan troglodytes TaxID=9598 RepID=UPI0030135985
TRSAAFTIPSLKQRSPKCSTGRAELGKGEPSPCTGRPERRRRRKSSPAPPAPTPDAGPQTSEDLEPPPHGCQEADRGSSWGATAPRPFRQNLNDLGRRSALPLKRNLCPGGSSLGAPPPRTRQRRVTLAAQGWLSRPRRRAEGLGELDQEARLAALGLRWGVDSLGGCRRASRPAGHSGLHHSLTCLRRHLALQAGASGHAGQLPQRASAAWEQQGQSYTALHLAAMYLGDGEAASGDIGRRCGYQGLHWEKGLPACESEHHRRD